MIPCSVRRSGVIDSFRMQLDANVAVLSVYLLSTTAAALYFARRQRLRASAARSGENYFLGGRSMAGWALGCSLVATQMSSVTFLAYPATSFATNWLLLNSTFGLPFVSIFTAAWVVPFFRRAVKLSAYELLEARFNLTCRLYVAFCYCLLQLARTCTILYLVSFPLATLTGASPAVVIICSGFGISLYTVVGGFYAVVFTDVVQAITLLLSGVLVFTQCVNQLPSDLGWALANASAAGKFSLTVDAAGAGRSAPLLQLFSTCLYLLTLCVYQDTVQRVCAASSLREARIAIMVLGVAAIPIWAFFMLIGALSRRLWAMQRVPRTRSRMHVCVCAVSVSR